MLRTIMTSAAALMLAVGASPAFAEIVEAEQDHFVTRNQAVVDATPTEVWLALISPAGWWSSEHSWSGDAANLKLTPQAGGCFCEKIPEVDEPGRFTLEGSVEHMRVIQAYPEVALRMTGALGPLQSEPVAGVLTIALSKLEDDDGKVTTRIVWEYNVGGKMRYPMDVIAPAVDGVMTLQLSRLAELLGVVEAPKGIGAAPEPEAAEDAEEAAEPGADAEEEAGEGPVTIDPEAVIEEAPAPSAVDDAFGDLSDDG